MFMASMICVSLSPKLKPNVINEPFIEENLSKQNDRYLLCIMCVSFSFALPAVTKMGYSFFSILALMLSNK